MTRSSSLAFRPSRAPTGLLGLLTPIAAVLLAAAAVAEPRALSLSDALTAARADNPRLTLRRALAARAESRRLGARQAFLPRLGVDATYLRLDDGIVDSLSVEGRELSPLLSSFALTPLDGIASGVEVVQPLVNVGAWHAGRQAEAGVAAAGLSLERARRVVDAAVVEAYYGLRTAERRVAATRAGLAAAERGLRQAEAGFEQELVAPVDVASARSRAALLRGELAAARAGVAAAEAGLGRLLGFDDGRALRLTDPVPAPASPPTQPPAREAVLAVRRDVRALEKRVAAADLGVRRARAAFLPDLNLYARYNRIRGDRPLDFRADGWLLAVNLEWQLFAGFGQIAGVREASANERAARARLEAARRQAWSEVRSARANWDAAVSGWRSARAAVEASRESLALTEARYAEGLDDMTALLRAQAEALRARLREVDGRYRAVVARTRYRLAAEDGPVVPGGGR